MTDTPLSANIQLKAQLLNIFCHVSFEKATIESPISSEMKKQEVDFPLQMNEILVCEMVRKVHNNCNDI